MTSHLAGERIIERGEGGHGVTPGLHDEEHDGVHAELLEHGLRESLHTHLVEAAATREADGAGCLLLDAEGALRFVAATGVAAHALEVAEELCVEGPCHEAFANGPVSYDDVLDEPHWGRLSTLLAASPVRAVVGAPIPVFGAPLGALDAFASVPNPWSTAAIAELRSHAQELGSLIELALSADLDQRGDALTTQLRQALATREVLHAAEQVVLGADEPAAGLLQVQQLAAAAGVTSVEVARLVVQLGRLPDPGQLREQVAETRRRSAAIEHLALTDPLTGLANRARFFDRLEQALLRTHRLARPPAIMFIDLDGFKAINDTFGHEAGDQVLREVAERLTATVRIHDTVCRMGGDEFAVLCEETEEPRDAAQLADRIADALSEPIPTRREADGTAPTAQVRSSIGVAIAAEGKGAAELLREADMAMYAAKRTSNGGAHVFHERMRENDRRRTVLERSLRELLGTDAPIGASDGIRLVFQPIVELASGHTVTLEALVRWSHPELGEVSAPELIDVAESTGMIIGLGERLLAHACGSATRWQQLPGGDAVDVAVNVSAMQLMDTGFARSVARALDATGLAPHRLCLELTETKLLEGGLRVMETVADLADLGVGLTLDDFGTGYSSLAYLADLPVQVLKVDRTFVSALGVAGDGRSVVARAVVGLAAALELDTVAEGVERREQVSEARDIGCRLGQGYFFSRPVDELRLVEVLDRPLPARAPERR